MFRTLRARLVLSHILPMLVIVPIMYIALVYVLETRFLLPRLTQDLLDDARLLTEVTRAQVLTYGGIRDVQFILVRLPLDPAIRVVYMESDGTILSSNDPDYLDRTGQRLELQGLERARSGEEVIFTNYSFLPGSRYNIQVLLPVQGIRNQVAGIIWMTYFEASITRLFRQMRSISVIVMFGFLLLGTVLGSLLAVNIGRPIRQVTDSIHSLARGERSESLAERGPEEIRDLIRAINYLVDRLQGLEKARKQLLANLVHELGRPLGALRSAIQALAKGAGEDPKLLNDLATGMDEETARMQNILDELAHLHDQVLGSLEMNREWVDMSEWLPKVLIPWGEAAADKGLHWEIKIPSDLPNVQIDRMRFAQIFGNLVSNAIKYAPTGRSVIISAGVMGEELWISVKDTGPGIPEGEQEKIFDPFYRGDQGRRIKQGMGLGLSIARDLIAAHEGRIKIDSAPGFGSTFTIWLPIS